MELKTKNYFKNNYYKNVKITTKSFYLKNDIKIV